MSDILIKNMKMPENCMGCPFRGFDRAGGRGNICTINESIALHAVLDGVGVKFVRMGDCPLIEIPTPHGRLGDLDRLEQMFVDIDNAPYSAFDGEEPFYTAEDAAQIIRSAPTIIEREDGT